MLGWARTSVASVVARIFISSECRCAAGNSEAEGYVAAGCLHALLEVLVVPGSQSGKGQLCRALMHLHLHFPKLAGGVYRWRDASLSRDSIYETQ